MITTCTKCGSLYEAGSEEQAYEPVRHCFACRKVSTDEAQPTPQGASGKPQTGPVLIPQEAAVTKSGDSRERPAFNLDHISNGEGHCREGNEDDEHGMCPQCQAAYDAEAAHHLAIWNGGMREIHAAERDPKAFAESMRDAGRGHLVRHLP